MTDVEKTKLLERFMAGETTLEEEKILSDFFQTASDAEKPKQISDEDWIAYREMFRVLDEAVEMPQKSRGVRLWLLTAAAAVAAIVFVAVISIRDRNQASLVAMIDSDNEQTVNIDDFSRDGKTVAPAADKQKISLPSDTLKDSSQDDAIISSKPSGNKKHRKLPYIPPIPRHYIAKAAKAHGVSVDSMAIAFSEAERLIEAATVYQEIRINELCDVEYEEYY